MRRIKIIHVYTVPLQWSQVLILYCQVKSSIVFHLYYIHGRKTHVFGVSFAMTTTIDIQLDFASILTVRAMVTVGDMHILKVPGHENLSLVLNLTSIEPGLRFKGYVQACENE